MRVRFALATAAVAWFVVQYATLAIAGHLPIPGGDVRNFYDAAGDALRSGGLVYFRTTGADGFYYSPVWAVIFGATSWLPPAALHALLVAGEVAALRYLAGSWFGFCLALAFPLMPWELGSGNVNLIVAAAIVAGIRGNAWLALLGAAAKMSPVLALNPANWRSIVRAGAVLVAITLPWWHLWPQWFAAITGAYGQQLGSSFDLAYPPRLAIAVALIALHRPWARALAAVIAIPALHYVSVVLLLAPLAVALRGWASTEGRLRWAYARPSAA